MLHSGATIINREIKIGLSCILYPHGSQSLCACVCMCMCVYMFNGKIKKNIYIYFSMYTHIYGCTHTRIEYGTYIVGRSSITMKMSALLANAAAA